MLALSTVKQKLIMPIHRSLTLSDILPRLAAGKYLKLINTSSRYHNLRLDEQLSYVTTSSYPFGRYRYTQLPFGVAPAGDMF